MNEGKQGGLPGGAEHDPMLERLYRAAAREEPAARLDAAILAAAHRETGARPRAATSVLRRWQVPVSIAAVLVLSVSLVTLIREEGGEQLMQPPPPAPAASQPVPILPQGEPTHPSDAAPAPARPAPRQDVLASSPPAAPGAAAGGVAAGVGPAAPKPGEGAAVRSEPAPRPEPAPFRDASGPPAPESRVDAPPAASAEDIAARAPAAAERRSPPAAAAPAPERSRSRIMAQSRKEAASPDAGTPAWSGFETQPPQKWRERIGELRRHGRVAEAEAMLAEYKRRFPGHPLPPEQADSPAPGTGP